jgi:GxxExxY protein
MDEEQIKEIAYGVTGAAFRIHNELGAWFSEAVYQRELAAECRRMGYEDVRCEVPVHVMFDGFRKDYFIDLLLKGGALFEIKAARALSDEHRAQTLHYLFLSGFNRAKLINLGASSVEHEFVSTGLTGARRRELEFCFDRFVPIDKEGAEFAEVLTKLLMDWGGFLQLALYYDGVMHFLGGEECVLKPISVTREGREIATQRGHLLNPTTEFRRTAVEDCGAVEVHLRRFLDHTNLHTIQWVNLHHSQVTFTTLFKYSCP